MVHPSKHLRPHHACIIGVVCTHVATLDYVVSVCAALLHAALNLLRCSDNPVVAEGGDKG